MDKVIKKTKPFPIIGYYIVHILLGYLVRQSPILATLHAWGALAVGIVWALQGEPLKPAYVCSYIVGAEVLWRMSKASALWEFGKYSVIAIMLLSMMRKGLKFRFLPVLYFLLLVPGALMAISAFSSFDAFRKEISFNLSGPLTLCICTLFFFRYTLPKDKFYNLLLAITGPIVGIAFSIAIKIASFEDVKFSRSSNFMMSGGFGPNQVSSILGLGVFILLFYIIENPKAKHRLFLLGVMIWLAAQSALTFSRGGLYAVVLSVLPASLFLIQNPKIRNRVIAVSLTVYLLGSFVVWPKLVRYTDGNLKARFESTKTSGRDVLIDEDIQMWKNHFFLGVGAAQSKQHHKQNIASHTEFTRLLAEHGFLGLLAILTLLLISRQFFLRSSVNTQKGLVVGMVLWSFAYMCTAAMRIAAPSFIFGLAAVRILSEAVFSAPPQKNPESSNELPENFST